MRTIRVRKTRRRTRLLRSAICALLGLTSCSTLSRFRFEQPTLRLETIEITGLDLSGGSFTLWLDVFNPNNYEITTTRIVAELELEGTHFGSTELRSETSLPSAQHTRVALPVTFTWEGVGAATRALLQRGAVNYDMEARMWLGASLGNRQVVLRRRGEVPIDRSEP